MATIKSQMVLNDGISGVLKKITSALDTTLAAFEQMQQASGNAVDVANIEAARAELASAGKAVDEMADDYKKAAQEEEKLNENIHQGSAALDGMVGKVLSLVAAYASLSAIKGFAEETMEAANVQINAQVQLRTVLENMGAMDTYDALAEQIDGAELENNLLLDTSEAADSYSALEANINNAGLANELILDTAGALDSCENFSKGAGRMDLSNTLFLDTAAASEAYEILTDSVDGAELSNALLLDTAAASKAYEMLAGGMDGAELPNTLLLDTAAASEAYEILADSVDGAELSNTLVLETAGAENDYSSFLSDVSGGNISVPVQADSTQAVSAYDAILAKASDIQSKGIYGDEIMIAGAAEFATYFSDADAIISMMDTLSNYAMGMSGGGALDTNAMVDYATGIGKLMTGSYGAMTKKGFEFTDAQKAIIEGTATEAQIVETLGEEYLNMSADMQAAAAIDTVISESWSKLYETMSNTPEGKLIQLNNTLGDIKENIGAGIYPAVTNFVEAVQSGLPQIESAAASLSVAIGSVIEGIANMVDFAVSFGTAVSENWSWIEPIIHGIAAALGTYVAILGVYNATQAIANVLEAAAAFQETVHAAAVMMSAGATFSATVAQYGFNAALLACPITWLVIGIITLFTVVTALVRAFDIFGAKSHSVFGTLLGWLNVVVEAFRNLLMAVINVVIGIVSAIAACCDNMKAGFHNAISSVKSWFYDLLSTALSVVSSICAALNSLPFVEFDFSGISGKADEYAAESAAAAADKMEYSDVSAAFDEGFHTLDVFSEGWAEKAFQEAANWGDGVVDNLGYKPGTINDYADRAMGIGPDDPFAMEGLGGDVGDIADNTKAAADSLEVGREELSYLRDIAERDAINRFTTAEVKIDMTGMTNRIDSDLDIDGVIRQLTEGFTEALSTAAEGVHP